MVSGMEDPPMRNRDCLSIYVGYCEGCGRRVTDEEMAASMEARSNLLLCYDCLIRKAVTPFVEPEKRMRFRSKRSREWFLTRRASPTFIFCAFGITAGFLMLITAFLISPPRPSSSRKGSLHPTTLKKTPPQTAKTSINR